jgi:hypothetical protein
MRASLIAALAGAFVCLAAPANSAVVLVSPGGTTPATLPIALVPLGNGQFTGGSSDQFIGTPDTSTLSYTFSYIFALPADGAGNASFTTTSSRPSDALLNVTSVTLGSQPLTIFTNSDPNGATTYSGSGVFNNGSLGDLVSLVFTGTVLRGGTLATSISYSTAAPAAVPETATWAMMILGFGMIGGTMRVRRRQQVRVTYA